jgi:hypothetical protein
LIVKSRRWASRSAFVNVTLSGWRPSLYVASLRNVATSIWPAARGPRTVTTPNAAPIGSVRRWPNRSRIWSGVALVATS